MLICRLIRRSRASYVWFVFRICPYYTNGCAYIKLFSPEWKTSVEAFSLQVLLAVLTDADSPADMYSYFLTCPTNPQSSYSLWVVESLPDCFVFFLTPEVFASLFLTDELIGLTSSVNPFSYHFHIYSNICQKSIALA